MKAVRTHYLDASAIVKLLVYETGCEGVRNYFNEQSTFYTTSLCFAETLGILKSKRFHRKPPDNITEDQYIDACNDLMAHISCESIGIDDIQISDREVFTEIENIVQKYSLDISDAFQIYTLKEGYFSRLSGESSPILITADERLAEVARNEGLRAWNCVKEPIP